MWKTILNQFSIYIVIGILCVSLWRTYNQASKYQQKADRLETTICDLNQEIKYTKILFRDSIALYQAEVKSLNITRNNLEAKYHKLLKSTKTKAKDVNNVTELASVIRSVDTVVAVVDSFGGLTAQLEDPYVSIDVEVFPDRNTIIDYEVRDSITVLNIQKKHSWLFGLIKWKEQKGVKVINHNPKANIISLQTIDIIDNEK